MATHDEFLAALAARLRTARLNLGVNARAFGYNLAMQGEHPIGQQRVRTSRLETGSLAPRAYDVACYAWLTGADPAWLLLGDDREQRLWVPEPDHDPRPPVDHAETGTGGRASRGVPKGAMSTKRAAPTVDVPPAPTRPAGPTWRPAGWPALEDPEGAEAAVLAPDSATAQEAEA